MKRILCLVLSLLFLVLPLAGCGEDPAGEVWQERTEIAMTRGGDKEVYTTETELYSYSCFYTGMVQLDANTAILVYSDFWYPNKNKVGVKTILTRTVHIVPKNEG